MQCKWVGWSDSVSNFLQITTWQAWHCQTIRKQEIVQLMSGRQQTFLTSMNHILVVGFFNYSPSSVCVLWLTAILSLHTKSVLCTHIHSLKPTSLRTRWLNKILKKELFEENVQAQLLPYAPTYLHLSTSHHQPNIPTGCMYHRNKEVLSY